MSKEKRRGFSLPPIPEGVRKTMHVAGAAGFLIGAFYPFQENGHPDGRLPIWETKAIEYISNLFNQTKNSSEPLVLPQQFDSQH